MTTTRKAGTRTGDEQHAKHGVNNPAPEAGMSRDVINMNYDMFKRGIKDYSEKEQQLLEWLWGYAFSDLQGSKSALCDSVGKDWTVLLKVFQGRYDARLDNICADIRNLKKKVDTGGTRLVSTVVTQRIEEALNYARDTSSMVTITGSTGRSKTFTAQHWARLNNHGRSKYVRAASGSSRGMFVKHLCKTCGIGVNGKNIRDLEQRLFKAFDYKNVLIVDEAGHLLPTGRSKGGGCMEFVRDLHDICGCGVALIFTDVYLDDMKAGGSASYFEQFIGRIGFEVAIPPQVLKAEVKTIVESFRKEPGAKTLSLALQIARNRDGRLRTLFKDLQRANAWAIKHGGKLSYDALKLASEWRLSGCVWPE